MHNYENNYAIKWNNKGIEQEFIWRELVLEFL